MKNLRILGIIICFILCVVLQTTVTGWISIFGVKPDLLIIFVVYQAFKNGPAAGAVWGFLVGFSSDVYGPVEWLGTHTIAMTLLGYLCGLLEDRYLTLQYGIKIVALGFGVLFSDLVFMALSSMTASEMTHAFLRSSLPECAYTVVVGGVAYYFLFRGKRKRHA